MILTRNPVMLWLGVGESSEDFLTRFTEHLQNYSYPSQLETHLSIELVWQEGIDPSVASEAEMSSVFSMEAWLQCDWLLVGSANESHLSDVPDGSNHEDVEDRSIGHGSYMMSDKGWHGSAKTPRRMPVLTRHTY